MNKISVIIPYDKEPYLVLMNHELGLITLSLMILIANRKFMQLENLVALCISLLIPGLVYFIWRLSYFKNTLPLSFYHKSFVSDLSGHLYAHASRSVLFTDFVGMILIGLIGIILYRVLTRSLQVSAYMLLTPSTLLVLYYSRVSPVAGLQYRFFFPYVCAFFILASDDLADYFRMITSKTGIILGSLISTTLFLFVLLGPFFYETRNTFDFFIDNVIYDELSDPYMNIGKTLLKIDESEPIAIGEVGKIGLLLRNYTVVDVVGLNDVYLARHPFSTKYLDEREVNVLILWPYPGASLGVYAGVYRKIGENFDDIEKEFLCVGNIEGLDVFLRSTPHSLLEDNLDKLRRSKYFQEGVCLSVTMARWEYNYLELQIENWSYSDMEYSGKNGRQDYKVTGSEPILRSPVLNLDASDYNNLYVRILAQPPIECNTVTMYFTKTDALSESDDRSIIVPFEPSSNYQYVIVNVRKHPEWRNTIHKIRLDPVCGLNSDGTPIRFEINSVTLGQDRH